MRNLYYMGRFTPATGGVTVKNCAVYDELSKWIEIEKLDLTLFKKGNVPFILKSLKALFSPKSTFVVGTSRVYRRVISYLLYRFNRSAMERSVLMVMGGALGTTLEQDEKYRKWCLHYGSVYVETEKMKDQLEALGFQSVLVFPNCRKRPESIVENKPRDGRLKCVCFSMIYPEKGIDTALEAASKLPDVDFDFWGAIDSNYKEAFLSAVDALPNARYNGIFMSATQDVYKMLNGYDLFLFPTRCESEGVPGALVEAKIAGVPAIVSNVAYNAELVADGVSGIVLTENTSDALVEAICQLELDDERLSALKEGAKVSGETYFFDAYIKALVEYLEGEKN